MKTPEAGALNGIRVIDFSFAYSGSVAGEVLALMGAQVIKIETRDHLDISRTVYPTVSDRSFESDSSPFFAAYNLNKLGITLNLKNQEALALAKKLVTKSDVVIECFRPGIMKKLGLNYEVLQDLNPKIIMLSSSSAGGEGPEAHYRGYASIFAAIAGLGGLTGYGDGPPSVFRITVDIVSSYMSAIAVLAALNYRAQTGEGQYIDMSSEEALSSLVSDSLFESAMNMTDSQRMANQDDIMAPHNCYRCNGEDKWISIAVASDDEWLSFCRVIGNPLWTKETRFVDSISRWENQDELDKLIDAWTMHLTNYDVMYLLQNEGVAAVPSFTSQDMFTDPNLKENKAFKTIEQPGLGSFTVMNPPWELSQTPARITHPAPQMGEHNQYVLGEILGLPQEELARLESEGALQ